MRRIFSILFALFALTSAHATLSIGTTAPSTTMCPPGAMGASCMSEDGTNSNNTNNNTGIDVNTGKDVNTNGIFDNHPGSHVNTAPHTNSNMNTNEINNDMNSGTDINNDMDSGTDINNDMNSETSSDNGNP